MGLDIYVGTLTRYYLGDWETAVQRYAREEGLALQVIRPGGTEPNPPKLSASEIREIVTDWRDGLNASLLERLREPLVWAEENDSPYFTDKPAWDGHGALLMLAAYEEHGIQELPPVVPEHWEEDPLVKGSLSKDYRSIYTHLLGPELWLPSELPFTFRCSDVAGQEVWVGSSFALLHELRTLNDRTLRGSPEEWATWRREGAEYQGPFLQSARFGLSVFVHLTEQAVLHRLPMKLDY